MAVSMFLLGFVCGVSVSILGVFTLMKYLEGEDNKCEF